MALALYPPEMKQGLILEIDTQLPDRRIRAQPQRGRAFDRRGPSAQGGRPVNASTIETTANLARFWRFYREEINEGADPFILRDQQLDGWPVLDENGESVLDENSEVVRIASVWVTKFVAVPGETRLARNAWRLSYQLLVLNA